MARIGIAEREVEVAEETGRMFYRVLTEILKAYGIDITEGEAQKVAGEKIRGLITAGDGR